MFDASIKVPKTHSQTAVAAAPPMFDASIKVPQNLTLQKSDSKPAVAAAPPMFDASISVPKTHSQTGVAAAPPMFDASIKVPQSLTLQKSDSKPAVAAAPPMFDASVNVPQNLNLSTPATPTVPSAFEASIKTDSTHSTIEILPSAALPPSVVSSFEAELVKFESLKFPSVSVTTFDFPSKVEDTVEAERKRLVLVRDAVRKQDTEVRALYVLDPASAESVAKLEDKCAQIHQAIDAASAKVKGARRRSGRLSAMRVVDEPARPLPVLRGSPVASIASGLVTPQKPASPAITAFHPLPPSLRKEAPGGVSLLTPIKAARNKSDLTFSELLPIKPRRSLVEVPKLAVKHKPISLADMLAGKILGSPSDVSSPEKPQLATGHGAAWQLLRQVEQQTREIDALLQEIDAIDS